MSLSQQLVQSIEQFRDQAQARSRYWLDAIAKGWGHMDNDAYAQAMKDPGFASRYQPAQLEFFALEAMSRPPALFLARDLMVPGTRVRRARRPRHAPGQQIQMIFQLRLF